MWRHFCLLLLLLGALSSYAQDSALVDLSLEARGDYQRNAIDGDAVKDDCGFKGQYLNLVLNGNITPKLSYSFRHRLNKMHKNQNFFDATDWLHLDYKPTPAITLSAGKQVVWIGGFEYDRAPIDLYFCSEFWNNIPCYQWGGSAGYTFNRQRDQLLLQFCESPFRSFWEHSDMYAYNLLWRGSHGPWSTIWSVNAMEWKQGRFMSYISLGNQFQLGSKATLAIDFLNRASNHQTFLFKDCSVVGEVSVRPIKRLNIFGKYSYDVNHSGTAHDLLVLDGTEVQRIGAGVEFFPLRNHDVRLHANYSYSWGSNANPHGATMDKQSIFGLGLTWKMNLLHFKKTASQSSASKAHVLL